MPDPAAGPLWSCWMSWTTRRTRRASSLPARRRRAASARQARVELGDWVNGDGVRCARIANDRLALSELDARDPTMIDVYELADWILVAVGELGGTASRADVLRVMEGLLGSRLADDDIALRPGNGDLVWKNNASFARKQL